MSDYFFYDINKKMADLAKKQQLTEDAQVTPANPAPSALRTQLNERDLGKHNNATTGFAALAKKTGGGEKGAKIAGAQLAKMRAKGQVEEGSKPDFLDLDKDGNRKEPMRSAARSAKKGVAGGSGDPEITPGMKTQYGTVVKVKGNTVIIKASNGELTTMNIHDIQQGVAEGVSNIKQKIIKLYKKGLSDDEIASRLKIDSDDVKSVLDDYEWVADTTGKGIRKTAREGNAFSGAVVKAKRDGVQPGEKIRVGGKEYPVREASAPVYGPGDMEGATAPPAKGKDGQYPIVTAGPHKGKRWSPTTPGPTNPTMKEAAKYRDPKYKDKLYTQNPPEDDADTSLDTYYNRVKPAGYQGAKRLKGGDEYARTDPLTRGFGRSGTGSPVEKGPRKGLPKRDQITSLKGSIKDAHGTHTQPNLPEASVPMTPKQKSFAKLAPPADKITFADKIAGAKKEVDEMLGNVAADAMKKAIGGGRGRNAEMDESGGHIDWSDDDRGRKLSSTGGRIDTSTPGVTRHTPVKGNYSGAGHDAHAGSDGPSGAVGRRRVGAGQGTKIGAKINTGKSKLMTREGDQDPADQGEYDREGEMGRNEIHTMMRNAKQLEKMLGNNDDLPEWVQKKLSLASDYMQTIADYLASERETDAEDETGRRVEVELAEKKAKPTKQSSGNDGNLANNAKPYDKVTQGDVVAGRLGKDEMGGKKKSNKPSAKKEEEVEESTTAGSVATAPTSSKASKGGMSFGKGIYDSIDRAVERQINESMNISMSMNNDGGGAGQTLTITATDEDASQLALLLKMAGMGGGGDMSHGEDDLADQIRQAEQGHGGCDEMVDETYGDNVVDMNSPNYPTNTESAENNFGYSGGVNKPKRDVAGNGQTTVPVTAVRGQDNDFQESIQRMREIAGIKETPSIFFPDPRDTAKQLGIKAQSRLIDTPTSMSTGSNRSYNNTFLDPAQKAQQRLSKQNESIFTDTANLWKSYKG